MDGGRSLLGRVRGVTMKTKLLVLIACIALVGPAEAATYNIDYVNGIYTISGSITTDGTSPVAAADISAYSLSFINTGSTIFTLTNSNAAPSTPLIDGSDLTTTSTTISFNFGDDSAPGEAYFQSSAAANSIRLYMRILRVSQRAKLRLAPPATPTSCYTRVATYFWVQSPPPRSPPPCRFSAVPWA